MQPLCMFVDKNDIAIGAATIKEIEEKELTARLSGVLIIRSNKNIVLHKVAPQKKWGLRWNVSAAGHVDENETYEIAALRELKEELGITLKEEAITKIGYYCIKRENKTIGRFATIFEATYDGSFSPDKKEICEIREFTPEELKKELKENKDNFTWLAYDALQTYLTKEG